MRWSWRKKPSQPTSEENRENPKRHVQRTIIVVEAKNPDGASTFIACLMDDPLHLACGASPIEAVGAFVILHHALLIIGYAAAEADRELPKITEDGETTIGVMEAKTGYQGFIANRTVCQTFPADAPVDGKLSWVAVSTKENACWAAGEAIKAYGWTVNVLVDNRTGKPWAPVSQNAVTGPTPAKEADSGGSGCCQGDCGL